MIGITKHGLLLSSLLLACGTPEAIDPKVVDSEQTQVDTGSAVVDSGPFAGFAADVVRLSPEVFTELPLGIREALLERGCTIPQAYEMPAQPHNVVRASFRHPSQEDWAVLCSRNARSSILVFWSGRARDVEEFGEADDDISMQVVAPEILGFSRYISAADAWRIRQAAENYSAPVTFEVTHSGIEDAFVGKASVIHYHHQAVWVRLQGAD